MIEEPSKKRVYWAIGKVISLLPGRDGKVRTLKLKFKDSELIRPIQRVYPLEVPFINNEIVKMDGVPTSSVKEDELTSNAVIRNKITRLGRLVKIPERDLNYLMRFYMLLRDSNTLKRVGDCCNAIYLSLNFP
ncbi:hypothetical protein TNCT_392421 [Trichonephila clavata]|uniref:DUF5641 domain-containing protein n=1 Tax=Trichonephila clavata TaxID=2740835 RepID=A0A8X6G4T2_TRICU|nr:hypothetical protein TNCT_392421 [Trichonephila clavata]